jgi:hypothetical protein
MTRDRSRAALALAALALTGAALVATLVTVSPGEATAAPPRVLCTQVPAKVGQLDEQYVANFMSEQLVAGKTQFTTVHGLSTVLCAY